jgi:hypothetical protein
MLVSISIFFGIGLVVHLCERLWPLRAYEKPKAWAVDGFSYGLAIVVGYGIRHIFPHIFGPLAALPGFGWMSVTSRFVETTLPWPVAFLISAVVLDFLL